MKSNKPGKVLPLLLLLSVPLVAVRAAVFDIASGDIDGLKAAIATTNTNNEDDTINLAPAGTYLFSKPESNNNNFNAVPIIAADGGHRVTINGNGALITRSTADNTPAFRFFQISAGAVLIFNTVTLSNGQVLGNGGAILNDHGNLTMADCMLTSNMAVDSAASGGGISNIEGAVTLLRCTLNSNHATVIAVFGGLPPKGGAVFTDGGTVTFQLCTLSRNSAVGTHVNPDGSTSDIAGAGGAIAASATAHVAIANSTFYENATGSSGSALYSFGANVVELGNSIVVGVDVFDGGIVSRGYNLTNGDGSGLVLGAGDQTNVDPQLQPLAFFGGPTKTHAIPANSAAVDKGKRDTIPALVATTDQRGVPRPIDYPNVGPASGGDNSDIGAYEIGVPQSGPGFVVTSPGDYDTGACEATDCTLREAINAATSQAGANTITFAASVRGTIQLTSALPLLNTNLTINGPGANVLTVRREAGGDYRIFTVGSGTVPGPVVTIKGLSITNGFPGGSPANGGAIYNDRSALRIERCAITGNHATNGAGIYNYSGSITLIDSTVDHNAATAAGGGIFTGALQGNAALNIANVTFIDNSAGRGAAFSNSGSSGSAAAALQNVTFSGNTSALGAIYNEGATSSVALRNTILSPGANTGSFFNSNGATVSSIGHNLSKDAVGGDGSTGPGGLLNHATDKRNTDPQFDGGLRDNGGPTATIALQSTSPAVNTGDQNSAPTRDQRGFVRTGIADLGAFEFGGTWPVSLANISTRLRVRTGDNVLIGGFIITGAQAKRLLIRALGPSLPLAGKLGNPQLQVYNAAGQVVAQNNDWRTDHEADLLATMAAPPHDLEAAVTGLFDPAAYTVIVSGVNGGTGIAVVEVYDLDRSSASKLGNIATRGFVQTGDNVMIGGFIVLGPDSQRLILRALGPSIPVPNKLANPTLELFDGNGAPIGSNDDWRSAQQDEILDTGIAPASDQEAAIVRTVAPGSYTAIVRGANDATGVAVVEVYALD
jgi:CSLREA domain-containing protein